LEIAVIVILLVQINLCWAAGFECEYGGNFKINEGDIRMRSNKNLMGMSILFIVFAVVFSVVIWGDVSLAAKIGFFVLGFGSGVTAGQSFAKRSA